MQPSEDKSVTSAHSYHLSQCSSRALQMHARDPVRKPPNTIYCSQSDDKEKKILPTVPEEINLVFTEACRMHSCALTCQWKPVISQQELGLMRQYHTHFALWDRKKNWWSNWVISDMSYQLSGETQIPSFTEAKLYSLLAYVTCILEMEYFCFKELTCGQTHWHQAVSSPLKQYRVAEAHTIFFFSTLAMFPILHYYEQQR